MAMVAEDWAGGGAGGALERRRSPWRGETSVGNATPTVPTPTVPTPTVRPSLGALTPMV
jgi:hypothetical protein